MGLWGLLVKGTVLEGMLEEMLMVAEEEEVMRRAEYILVTKVDGTLKMG